MHKTPNVKLSSILSYFGLLLFISCGEDIETPEVSTIPESIDTSSLVRLEKIEKIFFNVPTPMETITILQKAGATYEDNISLDPEKVNQYTTTFSQAFALGVFGADLNYASVYNRSDKSNLYLSCVKKVGDALGIDEMLKAEAIERFESNLNNRDSLLDIISEMYWLMNGELLEEGREKIAGIIISGGWIEGVYLATQLAKLNPNNQEIKQRIAEQKHSVSSLLDLLYSYESSPDLDDMLVAFEELQELFDQIIEEELSGLDTTDEDGVPIIGRQLKLLMSDELLEKITLKAYEVRSDITS